MLKADVCVGSFSGVVPMAPSPLAISALLGLAGGPPSLSPSVAFFHRSIWKTTFMCRNSHKLLIGRDEFMIESFGSIIRWSGGQGRSVRAQLCVRWTVRQLVLYQDTFIQKSKACVYMSYAVFVRDDVCLPVFKVPLQRNATEISLDWGLALVCLSLKNLIYCPLAICNSQFAALLLYHATVVDFSSSASPSTLSSQCVSLIGAVGELNSAESLKEDGWRD